MYGEEEQQESGFFENIVSSEKPNAIPIRDARALINAMMREKGFKKLKRSDGITQSYSRLDELEDGIFVAVAAGIETDVITETLGIKKGALISWLSSNEDRSLRYIRTTSSRDLSELAHIRYNIINSPSVMNIDEVSTARLKQTGLDQLLKGSSTTPKANNAPTSPVVNISFGKDFNKD